MFYFIYYKCKIQIIEQYISSIFDKILLYRIAILYYRWIARLHLWKIRKIQTRKLKERINV